MPKFTLICEHSEYDDFTGEVIGTAQKITHEFCEEELRQIIENFEMFLRGSGFHINGTLDTITEEHIEDDGWTINIHEDWDSHLKENGIDSRKCSICNIEKETMKHHECFDKTCPKDSW